MKINFLACLFVLVGIIAVGAGIAVTTTEFYFSGVLSISAGFISLLMARDSKSTDEL